MGGAQAQKGAEKARPPKMHVAQWTTAAERTEAALDKHGEALMRLAESVGQHMAKLEANSKLQQLSCEVVGELTERLLE